MNGTREKALDIIKNDNDIFNNLAEQLDNINGFLGDDRCFPMDELQEIAGGDDFDNLMNRIFYGHDDDEYIKGYGDCNISSFNPNRGYFYFNGYGNLVSTDYPDYTGRCCVDELLDNVIDNFYDIDFDNDDLETLVQTLTHENEEN